MKQRVESLSIRTVITEKMKEGVLSEQEGQDYIYMIRTRTDDLIGLKVLPKKIATETNLIENKKLLTEFEGFKLLSPSDDDQSL